MSNSAMNVQEAMKKQNDAAMILSWHVFSTVAKRSNGVFSPASINAALTMMISGPGGDLLASVVLSFLKSSSIDELNAVFSVMTSFVFADGSTFGGPTIKVANGVWIEQSFPIDPFFKNLFLNFFKAQFSPVDFRSKAEQVRLEVNSWAEHHTSGLIKDLLPPQSVKPDTNLIYGNALYFKGAWRDKFPKSCTMDKDFHLLNGTSVSVPFMKSYKNQFIMAYDGFKVLTLPFRQGNDINRSFSMNFYLPDEKDGLDNLVEKMASTPGFLDSHIPRYNVEVGEFRIPKFKIEFGFSASNAFYRLGLDQATLYHKAYVEIDEEGAEAAAVTVTVGFGSASIVKRIDFVADHPFLFLIRENQTGTVLFVGQIFDPSKSS